MNRLTEAMVNIARSFEGIREVGGNNLGPQIEMWQRRCGLPPGAAYCMAMQWCVLDDACRLLKIRNVLRPCTSVVRTWDNLMQGCRIPDPVIGCWGFHRDLKDPNKGHIGIVDGIGRDGLGVFTIEGNTSPEGGREAIRGGGVWRHTPSKRPLGYFNLGFADVSVLFASQLAPAGP